MCLTAQLPNIGAESPVLHVLRLDILMGEAVNPSPNPQTVGPGLRIMTPGKRVAYLCLYPLGYLGPLKCLFP